MTALDTTSAAWSALATLADALDASADTYETNVARCAWHHERTAVTYWEGAAAATRCAADTVRSHLMAAGVIG